GRLRAELVVEDLERQRSLVAGRIDCSHEFGNRKISLAGETAEVPAPGEHIEVKLRRISELNQENAVARDRSDGARRKAGRQRMKTVEDDADGGMIGASDDLPGVAVVVDVASPRQGLVADAEAPCGGPFAQFAKIISRTVDAAERGRRDIAAHEQEVAAKLLHQVELLCGPAKSLVAQRFRQTFKITERLQGADLEAEIAAHLRDVARRAVEAGEVVFEDFDCIETCGLDGLELLVERAANRNRCDRTCHVIAPVVIEKSARSVVNL